MLIRTLRAMGLHSVADALQGKPAVPRFPKWPTVRRHFLEKHSTCEACGGKEDLEAHHVKAFHMHPELELDDSNLCCLCEHKDRECHFRYGHAWNWKDICPTVRADVATELKRVHDHLSDN
jgi:5-methylcytosine-specific restriction protein A